MVEPDRAIKVRPRRLSVKAPPARAALLLSSARTKEQPPSHSASTCAGIGRHVAAMPRSSSPHAALPHPGARIRPPRAHPLPRARPCKPPRSPYAHAADHLGVLRRSLQEASATAPAPSCHLSPTLVFTKKYRRAKVRAQLSPPHPHHAAAASASSSPRRLRPYMFLSPLFFSPHLISQSIAGTRWRHPLPRFRLEAPNQPPCPLRRSPARFPAHGASMRLPRPPSTVDWSSLPPGCRRRAKPSAPPRASAASQLRHLPAAIGSTVPAPLAPPHLRPPRTIASPHHHCLGRTTAAPRVASRGRFHFARMRRPPLTLLTGDKPCPSRSWFPVGLHCPVMFLYDASVYVSPR